MIENHDVIECECGELQTAVTEGFNYTLYDRFMLEDLANRVLFLNGEVTSDVIDDMVYFIMRWNIEDFELPSEQRVPITIYINSEGGEVTSGFSLIDTIRLSITPVKTVNIGQACSMAFLIFIAGNMRYSYPHAQFMMHDGEVFIGGSMSKVFDTAVFMKDELEEDIKKYILDRTKISEELYQTNYRKDYYFLTKKAKELGVVDKIVGTDCDISEIL